MWKFFVFLNTGIVFFCCCIANIAIAPAYNQFVQYADLEMVLPLLTMMAVKFRWAVFIVPVLCCFFSYGVFKKYKNREADVQNRIMLHFFMGAINLGLIIILFYLLAGILPFQKIGIPLS